MIEIPEIQQRHFEIKQGGTVHQIPVRNLGTKVALQLADLYDDMMSLQNSGDEATIDPRRLREIIRLFVSMFDVCIVDFERWRDLFDQLPLSIEIYQQVFEEMIAAMGGGSDSKKKTIGESLRSGSISGSARPGTRRKRLPDSTDSAA